MSQFEPIQFVEADAQRIQQELIQDFEQATGQVLYPGDPRRIFLLQLAPLIVAAKTGINFAGNQNLLAFAAGESLDALGGHIGVPRLLAQKSRVTMRFTLSAIQPNPDLILKGTRVTPDGVIFFATTADLTIIPGATTGDVVAESAEGGEKFNDFVAGQINIIVDPVPFVASAVNLDTSSGGSDNESDDAYRERQRLAPDSFSVAGPEGAYLFFAKSADVNIVDVAVTSPSDGVVNVYPLMEDGQLPTQTVLDKVLTEVNAKDRRPLTDHVFAIAPTVVNYGMALTYYISADRSAEVTAIRAAIENPGGAIDQYEKWQYSKLGRPITPDYLVSSLYSAGAFRVTSTAPVYTPINSNEVSIRNTPRNVVYGGLI